MRETQVLSFVLPSTTQTFLLSPSPAVSPAFANFKKVYVPYYISDEHSGHFYFLRRNIVSGVVDDIYWKGMIGQSGTKVVLSGASAGGARAARNCDFVADKIQSFGFDTSFLVSVDLDPFCLRN